MAPLTPLGTVITFIRSALFALGFYFGTFLMLVACRLVRPFGSQYVRRIALVWSRQHRVLQRWVLGQKVVVEGELPSEAHLIVCKHESMFETVDAIQLFNQPMIAAKSELAKIPMWGWVACTYGLIVVDREGGASAMRAIRAEAQAAIASGRSVMLYPEGTRVNHGEQPPLKSGFAGLYKMLQSPVIPVALDSGVLSPRNSFLKRAGTITYRIGEAIPAGLPRAEAERRVHAAINALNSPAEAPISEST